ncbi:hypothetical protein HYC85_019217 [Camellia sinensis]|uniref:HECT-type E3 ubiquitin transferase n=1 Tax=Camellia sinensis TaxID=4442 RepID=A0A7J7GMV4_CAMSI|nr:hypothetical protein HYC85_019217 [Camellia sinensis]
MKKKDGKCSIFYIETLMQKCFRGRKAVEAERLRVRDHFFMTYGKHCQNVDRHSFGLDSDFLRQLLFFFNPQNVADFSALVETCRLLQQFVRESAGDILSLFAGVDYSSKYAVVNYRVKQLAYACIRAVHQDRNQLKDQLFMTSDKSSTLTILLLEAVIMLIDPGLPWSCMIVGYLLQRNTYSLLREIVLTGKESIKFQDSVGKISSLESILSLMIPHVGQRSCVCANIDPRWSFASRIFTIPFLWKLFPYLREIFAARGLSVHYIHQMALCVQNHANVLPNDIATEFPGYACLLGNLLETAGVAFSQPDCSFDMAIDFAAVATFLLDALRPMQLSDKESKEVDEDEIIAGDEMMENGLNKDLELQISNAIDPRFLLQLTNVLFGRISFVNGSYEEGAHGKEVVAVGAACAFLHVTFDILPLERIMTVLAYRTELVSVLWKFMKRSHENQMWSALSGQVSYQPGDAPGWLLPLSVFCPMYKHMLMRVDNEEFYEQEKPLSIKDIKCLVVILRQALWELLWVNPVTSPNLAECAADVFTLERHSLEFIQHRVSVVASDLLSQFPTKLDSLRFIVVGSSNCGGAMFFSGDSSARKRVDLGGRSSKERDRQKLLEQTRLERNRRLWLRQQNSAAIKIQRSILETCSFVSCEVWNLTTFYLQKCFRGRKAVEAERLRVREHFFMTYGKRCQNVDRHSFGLDSDFLRQLLFFFNPQNVADFSALVETCRLLQQFVPRKRCV